MNRPPRQARPRVGPDRRTIILAAAFGAMLTATFVAIALFDTSETSASTVTGLVAIGVFAIGWWTVAVVLLRRHRRESAVDRSLASSRVDPELPSIESMVAGREQFAGRVEMARRALRWAVPTGPLFGSGGTPPGDVTIEHVDQGTLGNCGFVAALGALALSRPDVIRRMVEARDDGGVVVHLPRASVQLAPTLPLVGATPAFAASDDDGVLWPAYVEKAAAVLFGGYDTLHGISARLSFQLLLGSTPPGRPGRWISRRGLLRMCDGETPVVAVLPYPGGFHAYAVAACTELDDDALQLHLHNPWGTKHRVLRGTMAELRRSVVSLHTPNREVVHGVPAS